MGLTHCAKLARLARAIEIKSTRQPAPQLQSGGEFPVACECPDDRGRARLAGWNGLPVVRKLAKHQVERVEHLRGRQMQKTGFIEPQ